MAIVNPSVPDAKDPNYLNYSRGISQPDSNKTAVYSGQVDKYLGESAQHMGESALYKGKQAGFEGEGLGQLFEGIGNIFKQGVQTADSFLKKKIDADVYSAVDAERASHTEALEGAAGRRPEDMAPGTDAGDDTYRDPKTGQIAKPAAPMTLIQQEESAPGGIAQGLNRVNTIVEARANDKISETAYIGNLNSIMKSLRTQYPGYREYIDGKVAEVTGMQPANAYIRSLIADINAASTGSKSIVEKTEGMLREELKKGNLGAKAAMDMFRATGNVGAAEEFVAKSNAQEYYWKNVQGAHAYDASLATNAKLRAGQQMDILAPQLMDNHFDSVAMRLSAQGVISGAVPGTGTSKDIMALLQNQQQIREGKASGNAISGDTARKLATMLRSQGEDYILALRAEATNKGIYKNFGNPKEFEDRLEAYARKFTRVADLVQNEKYGLAYEELNQNRAIASIDQNKLMTSQELGMQTRLINAMEGWPNYAQRMFERLNLDGVGKDGKPQTLNDAMKDYIKQQRMLMQAPAPELLGRPPQSPKESINKINLKTGGGDNTPAAAVNLTLNMVHDITDPKVEIDVRARSAQAAFQNSNRGMLNEIQKDYVNRNGQKIRGQIDIYREFTSPGMTQSIKELDFKQPGLMNQYRSWAKDEFSNVLVRQDITSLRDIQGYKGMVVTYGVDNNGIASFRLAPTPMPQYDPQDVATQPGIVSERRMKAEYHIDRINQGLANYSHIVKQAGGDINADVIQILASKGVKPGQIAGMRIPEHMLEAVIRSQTKPEEGEKGSKKPDTMKATPFTSENRSEMTVGEFLANPVGNRTPRTQNAPAGFPASRRGNLSDEDILGIEAPRDIPPGLSPGEYIRSIR